MENMDCTKMGADIYYKVWGSKETPINLVLNK